MVKNKNLIFNYLKSCIPKSFSYGSSTIPVQINKYHPTLASMIYVGLGMHDRNVPISSLLTVRSAIMVNESLFMRINFYILKKFFFNSKHEDWDVSNPQNNDIALLKLMNDVTFSEEIQPACLPPRDFSYPDVNFIGYIAGWGPMSPLQNAPVNVFSAPTCMLDSGESKICLGKNIK